MNRIAAREPIGQDEAGKDVFLREIWPTNQEVQASVTKSVRKEMFERIAEHHHERHARAEVDRQVARRRGGAERR